MSWKLPKPRSRVEAAGAQPLVTEAVIGLRRSGSESTS